MEKKLIKILIITQWNTHSRMRLNYIFLACMAGCHQEFSSHAHGTKGYALISGPYRSQARIHKGQGSDSDIAWMFGQSSGGRPARNQSLSG